MAEIEHRTATVAEFRAIADSVGWDDHFDWPTMQASLDASLHAVVATENGRVVGTARVVGDGVRYFYIQDVMVDPAHEGEGIATTLTSSVIEWIEKNAAPRAFIGLFASPGAEGVYEELGFSTNDMTGMHL